MIQDKVDLIDKALSKGYDVVIKVTKSGEIKITYYKPHSIETIK